MAAPTLTEADLCAAFIAEVTRAPKRSDQPRWIAYPETAGFDILLVRAGDGVQVGIEAKLALNPHVLAQALPERERWFASAQPGPDYRAVLVPHGKCNVHVGRLCAALGVTVVLWLGRRGEGYYADNSYGPAFSPDLPRETGYDFGADGWYEWAPLTRCPVPEYIPDVRAGCSAPIALTVWKVKAIKLVVLAAERPVTRADFKHLQLAPTSWLCPGGWLDRVPGGWVVGPRTPDFARQHPRNFAEIVADRERWAPPGETKRAMQIQGAML